MNSRGYNGLVVGAGIVLIALGTLFLLRELGVFTLEMKYVAPVLLIALGVIVLIRGFQTPGYRGKHEVSSDGGFASYRPRQAEGDE